MRRRLLLLAFVTSLPFAALAQTPALGQISAPPANNVHLVVERKGHRFWRGAAPRSETLRALQKDAAERKISVTVFDLRHPATADDLTGSEHKLAPKQEATLSKDLGLRYRSVSATDKQLPALINQALSQGDVYIHCMYGVNRTGFAVGRFSIADKEHPNLEGLGKKDWDEGAEFQKHQVQP